MIHYILMCLFALSACWSAFADGAGHKSACNPFGSTPAKVVETYVPKCPRGSRSGPWLDSDGTSRYSCSYRPAHATRVAKLPLIVFLHPAAWNSDLVTRRWMDLLERSKSFDLTTDPVRRGFVLIAPQGRKTSHFYPGAGSTETGETGWDNWYRQMSPAGDVQREGKIFRQNVDAAAIDHFIAAEIAEGYVDPSRIYMVGWSNGGAMAYLYGLNRFTIAAIAVYSAPNAFHAFNDPCPQQPVFGAAKDDSEIEISNAGLAAYEIHNACDIGGICPNAVLLHRDLLKLGVRSEQVIINSDMKRVDSCLDSCGTDPYARDISKINPVSAALGYINHSRWPVPWTESLLEFFRGKHN